MNVLNESNNTQGLLREKKKTKTPSLRCTGLPKQVFFSLSQKRLLWLSAPPPACPTSTCPTPTCPIPGTAHPSRRLCVCSLHVHSHALAGHFLTSAPACVVVGLPLCSQCFLFLINELKWQRICWRGEHACFPPLVRTSEQWERSGMWLMLLWVLCCNCLLWLSSTVIAQTSNHCLCASTVLVFYSISPLVF